MGARQVRQNDKRDPKAREPVDHSLRAIIARAQFCKIADEIEIDPLLIKAASRRDACERRRAAAHQACKATVLVFALVRSVRVLRSIAVAGMPPSERVMKASNVSTGPIRPHACSLLVAGMDSSLATFPWVTGSDRIRISAGIPKP